MRMTEKILQLAVLATALGATVPQAVFAADSRIVPITATVGGKSYAQWAAAWWQWVLQTPASINPLTDTTGARCSVGQGGPVWFLAGTWGSGTATRTCTVAKGQTLLLPLANTVYGAFTTDPPEQRTEAFLRSQVTCIEGAQLSAEIDGVPVTGLDHYLEKSALFDTQLPVDNLLGVDESTVPGLLLSPTVDEGYYLLINPLSLGQHTIHLKTTPLASCAPNVDVTYRLTVAPSIISISGRLTGSTGGPLPGVTMQLAGNTSTATVTDSQGIYKFPDLAPGSYSVRPNSSCAFNPTVSNLNNLSKNTTVNFASTNCQ